MIGIVADDITGANDIGVMFAKSGHAADVYSYRDILLVRESDRRPDVLIVDTDSRFDDEKTAYEKVYKATCELRSIGAEQFFNKTCSVFRGNIGAEFDAMLDALGEEFAVIVLGFPKNGRVTRNGIHYVHGTPLEYSEFRNDPMHPMNQSNLIDILQGQTTRRVASISYEVIQQGVDFLRERLEELRESYSYVILDVTEQADLEMIARTVYDNRVICGSSALAEEMAKRKKADQTGGLTTNIPKYQPDKGLFIAAGSLMPQTAKQIEYMKELGVQTIELKTIDLFDCDSKSRVLNEYTERICRLIDSGHSVILHTSNDPVIVEQTKEVGIKRGLTKKAVSQCVSAAIAEVAYRVIQLTGQHRFIIAGGDTSAAVCNRLGIRGLTVWKEIQPGLPSCVSISDQPMLFVLKSGSFGTRDFFETALKHLKEELKEGVYHDSRRTQKQD